MQLLIILFFFNKFLNLAVIIFIISVSRGVLGTVFEMKINNIQYNSNFSNFRVSAWPTLISIFVFYMFSSCESYIISHHFTSSLLSSLFTLHNHQHQYIISHHHIIINIIIYLFSPHHHPIIINIFHMI